MKKIYLLYIAFTAFLLFNNSVINAQGGVSINAAGSVPDPSAMLDVNSTIKGELLPRMSTSQRNAIANPATGLFIYNTDCNVVNYNAGTPQNPSWATMNASNVLVAGVSIGASPAGAICAGTNVTFSATPSQNNLSPNYQWQVNGNNVGSNSSTYTTNTLNSGDVVSCVLTSSANCVTGSPATSNAITMLVNTVPAITGTTAAGFCTGSAVTLSASANIGTINWYSVSTGGASLSTGSSFTIAGLLATTTYYVDATANGCTTAERTAVTATFYPNAPAQPGAISGPTVVDGDSTTTYSISQQSNVANYGWTVYLGTIVSGQGTNSINVTWLDSISLGSVSVVANNSCGTSGSQSITVGIQTFSYTGGAQTFTVPTGVNSINIAVYGAQGANSGGYGGLAQGTLAVNPGDVLYVYVGGQNNWNGGGVGGTGGGGNGGDESDVRQGGNSINNWIIVAGGGGGGTNQGGTPGTGGGGGNCANGAAGSGGTSGYPPDGGAGSNGTCTNGGGAGNSCCGWTGGGGGGGLTSGGSGSGGGGYANTAGTGTQGVGGNVAANNSCLCCGGGTGCGGGGGYYGGGGTSDGQCSAGSGGGGSSWASASLTNLSFLGGVQAGNGKVVITW